MNLLERDAEFLRFLARHPMATSKQIMAVVFRQNINPAAFRRARDRLLEDKLIIKVQNRVPGGSKGGSGPDTFRLSPLGWSIFKSGVYSQRRTIDYHALKVIDVHISILDAVDAGWLVLKYFEIEQEAYHRIAGAAIQPDAYYELTNLTTRKHQHLIIEVDNGTESRAQITDKLGRYLHAREHNERVYKVFPFVIFIAVDQARAERLRRIITAHMDYQEPLFGVCTSDVFPRVLTNLQQIML